MTNHHIQKTQTIVCLARKYSRLGSRMYSFHREPTALGREIVVLKFGGHWFDSFSIVATIGPHGGLLAVTKVGIK